MSQGVLWSAVAVALLAPMAVARLFRPKACPKCGSPKVWLIHSRNQAAIGWLLFIVGVALHGWWHLLMAAGLLAIVTAPAQDSLGRCIACGHHWGAAQRAQRA